MSSLEALTIFWQLTTNEECLQAINLYQFDWVMINSPLPCYEKIQKAGSTSFKIALSQLVWAAQWTFEKWRKNVIKSLEMWKEFLKYINFWNFVQMQIDKVIRLTCYSQKVNRSNELRSYYSEVSIKRPALLNVLFQIFTESLY